MPLRIEDYALIGDTQTAALVGNDGSIDWLCLPRFDSDACFAALLGDERNGRWLLAPDAPVTAVRRRYRPDTLILETELATDGGLVRVTDCMPPRDRVPDIVRVVECLRGEVPIRSELALRFGYGAYRPWFHEERGVRWAVSGPDAVALDADVPVTVEPGALSSRFLLHAGERARFVMAWSPGHDRHWRKIDADAAVAETEKWWRRWSAASTYRGPWRDDVQRSLITLKSLTYGPTGGIVAAPTTSLPEWIGGVRNWDYRFCWLRDATFTLYALMIAGYKREAQAWRDWLLRAVAGDPQHAQILYGPAGERRLTEQTLDWLPGYEGSRPVRIGNAASNQFQLDVYGEVIDCLYQAERGDLPGHEDAWALQRGLVDFVESVWQTPDEGIWEVRGPRRDFTHSKVMAWVAIDRSVKMIERFGFEGPIDRWRALRDQIHADVCARGFDSARNTFTQFYGSRELDASALMFPLVGFLPPEDPRVRGTLAAIERELLHDGFVHRYLPTGSTNVDGLPPGEGIFLPCSFWLADNLAFVGRNDEARALFERLLALRNDVGLISEEYDPVAKRLTGNFPQAFTHVALVNTARNLSNGAGPARHRAAGGPAPEPGPKAGAET
ncbi:MAG TPA: glycoside hydrolase family 15 protein [Polyangia bacterium]|nr:glycoside hydrolase family 15 protein [Polyangia bacterium]